MRAGRGGRSRRQRALTEAVARYLFKLMAYKDEYEVARLHADTRFLAKVAREFEGDYKTRRYHLAPPPIAKQERQGRAAKQRFGPWMRRRSRVLARLKGLRGTRVRPVRPHRRAPHRARADRRVPRRRSRSCCATLSAGNLALAIEIARIPEMIRGYGHVKARHLAAARPKWDALMARWRAA